MDHEPDCYKSRWAWNEYKKRRRWWKKKKKMMMIKGKRTETGFERRTGEKGSKSLRIAFLASYLFLANLSTRPSGRAARGHTDSRRRRNREQEKKKKEWNIDPAFSLSLSLFWSCLFSLSSSLFLSLLVWPVHPFVWECRKDIEEQQQQKQEEEREEKERQRERKKGKTEWIIHPISFLLTSPPVHSEVQQGNTRRIEFATWNLSRRS